MSIMDQDVAEELRAHGFEVQDTSYEALMQRGELQYLRTIQDIPSSDTWAMLKSFPKYLAVHRVLPPEKGVFFVLLADARFQLPAESRLIYARYFPECVALCARSKDGDLVAAWLHAKDNPLPLPVFIKLHFGV